METGLKGKIVFITGAANGIGRATAVAFAREGATLGLVDIDEKAMVEVKTEVAAAGGTAHTAKADLSTGTGVSAGLDELLKATGGAVDVLVNNVGSGAIRTFDQLTDEEWEKTFSLNFMSYVRATRKLLPILRERKGVIVNNGSDLARQPEPVPIDYSASKAAVLALTKGLARAEGKAVRVNAVAPGPIWTPFWTKPGGFAETMGAFHKMEPQAAVEHEMKLRQLPLERLGTPEEVANVVVFLASDLASFVTSAVWGVDGGSIRSI
ncbi:SDR family oxidoreductase [Rhizobium ruizarguesonis]|jgi:NAD(P)-dependent dehydrogenase (short-subunit alcohol dehydrogenase family)|uniref:SDR family oxidoreductase n=1 Tax=Rhizobium ruizarguesonis TaxID=2081791 RepID=A0AAE8TZH1_9HYPH|nr:SDR family oxidoreductase [Rhizobium ruizarguesonis]MBY5805770.1 SDR family oxidoreductase [Rhizobium leguminosarum]NKJ71791.1 SDR family oxidoreductase [Rhizobium leguminosarum bv. viciae]QIO48370.1 SDR family oxidoreductase [Rhizobium leguminosarum bv. trifolii]MBY5842181.1 SDR family oxidoreductase [Rhizobium leguminosarum]MBY5893933.1 SDR family oxidoreductase [Rhizobium leguminosarum]